MRVIKKDCRHGVYFLRVQTSNDQTLARGMRRNTRSKKGERAWITLRVCQKVVGRGLSSQEAQGKSFFTNSIVNRVSFLMVGRLVGHFPSSLGEV